MSRALKISSDHPAVAYLVRLHADLGGRIQTNKAEAERLADAMRHVEAVIKLYDPDFSARATSVRRPVRANPWFKRGTMFRYALDALREGNGPMTVRQITDAVMAARQIKDPTADQRERLEAGLRSCLDQNLGRTVQQIGQGIPNQWRLIENKMKADRK